MGSKYEGTVISTGSAIFCYVANGNLVQKIDDSTTITANADGTLASGQTYTAWGETRSGTLPTDRQYTSQISEPQLGIYFYNARYYDPYLARFIQADTLIPQPGNPLAWDRYTYCFNSPIRYMDLSGHTPWDVVDVIFFLMSLGDFSINPTWANAGWLLLDTVGLTPVIPSVGSYIRRGSQAIGVYEDIVKFATRYGDKVYEFVKIAQKKGAYSLLKKFINATTDVLKKGAEFELEYAIKFSDKIVEIGRKLPGGAEIDFVLQGNVFVNVKNFDWSKSFYKTDFGLKQVIEEFLDQVNIYKQYCNEVRYIFKGNVPDAVRKALEAAGVVVEVVP